MAATEKKQEGMIVQFSLSIYNFGNGVASGSWRWHHVPLVFFCLFAISFGRLLPYEMADSRVVPWDFKAVTF